MSAVREKVVNESSRAVSASLAPTRLDDCSRPRKALAILQQRDLGAAKTTVSKTRACVRDRGPRGPSTGALNGVPARPPFKSIFAHDA